MPKDSQQQTRSMLRQVGSAEGVPIFDDIIREKEAITSSCRSTLSSRSNACASKAKPNPFNLRLKLLVNASRRAGARWRQIRVASAAARHQLSTARASEYIGSQPTVGHDRNRYDRPS